MARFTRVLCPTDLSEASFRAIGHAVAWAESSGATLTVLHVVPTFEPLPVPPAELGGSVEVVYPTSRDEVLEALRRIAGEAGADSTKTEVRAAAGDAWKTIVEQATALDADLIVLGTHGRSGFERFMVGSVTDRVLRKASCAVLTVPPHGPAAGPGGVRLSRILCPTDFSDGALAAFEHARDLAQRWGAGITVLHAIEWLEREDPHAYANFSVSEYRQHLIDNIRDRIQSLLEDHPANDVPVDDVVVLGRADREILRVAGEMAADLIVIGAHGHGTLGRTFFGSTTERVVRGAECPVLTVRSPRLS